MGSFIRTTPAITFGAGEFAALRDAVVALDARSSVVSITSPNDVLLRGDKTVSGHHLTAEGFIAICRELYSGCGSFMLSLLRSGDAGNREFASDLFNRLVAKFGERLIGRMLLVDVAAGGHIVGVVSRAYSPFHNLRLLDMLAAQLPGWKLAWAKFAGRALSVRFYSGADQGKTNESVYFRGLLAHNDESGRSAVVVCPGLVRGVGSMFFCREVRGVRHIGDGVEARIAAQVVVASTIPIPWGSLGGCVDKARTTMLSPSPIPDFAAACRGVSKKLCGRDSSRYLRTLGAKAAAACASRPYSAGVASSLVGATTGELARRTVFDFVVALLRTSRNIDWRLREEAERLAYRLVFSSLG